MDLTIAHFGDVHIHNLKRHTEYRILFEEIYVKLRKLKPTRILIAGDLFEQFVQITNEAKDLAGDFLHELSLISKVVIVPGNHDLMKKNKKRINSVLTLVRLLKNPNITYYGESNFFEDDDIVWVNYSHLEKNIHPFRDIPHTKDKSKIYIGIFHDPINGSTNDNGLEFKSSTYVNVDDFDGCDFVMAGDIHKKQFFRENKSIAFPGSTIQQDHGESPDNNGHGFLLWDIKSPDDFSSKTIVIDNPYNYITLNIHKDYIYDNIDLDNPYITPNSEIKVKWVDYSANVNFGNEMKIRQYIKDKWGIDKVTFDRQQIFTDVSDVEMVNESINVLDSSEQRKIFIEFLKINKYKDSFIKSIMEIDEKINERITINDNNGLTWSIEKYWLNNFKSYGDGNFIDFEEMDKNSLIQISGLNQGGKTTLLDALSYILYGKTTTTTSREKHGDNRYFNNKRDKDEVDAGAVININGEKYTIVRVSKRKWNKAGTGLSSVSTTVDYFLGDDILSENKLTDEQKKDTQKLLEAAIGDFDDFRRLVLTTADDLNSLLSMDRATFMDSLIRDAGFDVFDKKLDEFKEYRKEITEKRKNIDVDFINSEIEKIKDLKVEYKEHIDYTKSVISELSNTKKLQASIREEKIKQLKDIDEDVKSLNISVLEDDIITEEKNIEMNQVSLDSINELKADLENYNPMLLGETEEKYSTLNESVTIDKLGQSEYGNKISEGTNKIKLLSVDIENMTNNYINDLKSINKDLDLDIMKVKEDFVSRVNTYLYDANHELSIVVDEQNLIHTDIDRLMEDGKKLKSENDELETSSVCITCKRPLENKETEIINEKIISNRKLMKEIMIKIGDLKPLHESSSEKVSSIKDKINKIKSKDYSFDTELLNIYNNTKEKIKEIKEKITLNETSIELIGKNNIPVELGAMIGPATNKKSEISLYINDLEKELEGINKNLEIKIEDLDSLKRKIKKLKDEKLKIDEKKEKISSEANFSMNIERSKNNIKEINRKIEEFNKQLEKIKNNEKLEKEIEDLVSIIDELDVKIKEKEISVMEWEASMKWNDEQVKIFKTDLKTHKKYKAEDELLSTYMKCVHRDGLPTFLLKKSIHIINQELNNMLSDVDFTIFFDPDLVLRLSSDNRLDVSQNAIESSGMERTFTAVALKMALRKVNNKSKPNIVLLDEIMGKLLLENVDKFIHLLDKVKKEVDKLLIIEHTHPINYDVLIEVEKDELGVSTLEIEY